jgi:hypothetical protein
MKLFFTISILLYGSLTLAQGGFKRKIYLPGVITSLSKTIFEKPNGDYIAGGIIIDTINGFTTNRLCIMGLTANGQTQWVKKYGSKKLIYINNPFINRSFFYHGNYLYYATEIIDSNSVYKGALLKFDLNGDTIWQRLYEDSIHSLLPQMVTSSIDGGFLITGMCLHQTVLSNNPALLIKTNALGQELWRKKINKNFPNDHDGKAIIQDSASKKIVMVGYQSKGSSTNWGPHDNILILDSLGNNLAQHNFAGQIGGVLTDLIQTKDGKFVAVGEQWYPQMVGGTNLTKAFAVKFDVNAPNPPIWRSSYDALLLTNGFTCITELDNGDLLIGGGLDTFQLHNFNPNYFIRLMVLDNNGLIKSRRYYNYKTNNPNSNNYMVMKCLNPTSEKGFIAAIEVTNNPNPNPFFFVKFDSTGCDSTRDYCQMMAEVNVNEFQIQDVSFRVYPNPFDDEIKIDIHSISASFKDPLVFTITDITGKVLQTSQFNSLQKTIILETKNLSSGLYFLNSLFDGKSYTFKVYKE